MRRKAPAKVPAKNRRPFILFGRRPQRDPRPDPETALYGALLPDVRFLRQRGFGIHREGDRFRVGNRLMAAPTLKRLAARERRLCGRAP